MARLWASTALLPLALIAQLLVFQPATVTADPAPGPTEIYSFSGVVDEYVYDTSNTSVPVSSTNFNFTAVEGMVVRGNSPATPNTILLPLPLPAGVVMPDAVMSAASTSPVPIVNLVGAITTVEQISPDLLGMYGLITGLPAPTSFITSDRNFFMFVDPVTQNVEGGAVIGENYFRFETINGALVVTAFPFEVGLCRLEEARAGPDGPGAKHNMTKEERRAYRQAVKEQKKLGRAQKKEDAKAARESKRAQAQARKEGKDAWGKNGKRRQLVEHGHGHGHDHANGHDHTHDHTEMHRQLQTAANRLLVFIDFAPSSGVYTPWNGNNNINIVQCPATTFTDSLKAQIVSNTLEDFAPFNIDITTDRATYDAATGRKVAANIIQSATGVIEGGNTCGVAYLNSLGWRPNTVWVSCNCGLSAIPQIIAHEVGHIFSLRHDGTTNPVRPYLFGLPAPGVLPNNRRWNAIMGGVAPVGIEQWSKGEYNFADNREDDIRIIVNQVGPRQSATAACTTTFAYRDLSAVASTTVTAYNEATITCGGGAHSYPMRIRGGYALEVTVPTEGNLKYSVAFARARLRNGQWVPDGSFTTLGTNDAYSSAPFLFQSPSRLTAGNYIFRILSIAEPGNANTFPFPVYGSTGRYMFRIRNGL